jgi:hypothetical protein
MGQTLPLWNIQCSRGFVALWLIYGHLVQFLTSAPAVAITGPLHPRGFHYSDSASYLASGVLREVLLTMPNFNFNFNFNRPSVCFSENLFFS